MKALTHFDRNGFAYVLDRVDGTLHRATKYGTTDWAEKVDMKTGRPVKVREHSPLERGRNVSACPSAMGGKDQQPGSVDPKEPNIFYMPTNNWCMELEPQERTHTIQGTVYGTTKTVNGKITLVNIKHYPAEKVQPPDGTTSSEWINGGMKPAK